MAWAKTRDVAVWQKALLLVLPTALPSVRRKRNILRSLTWRVVTSIGERLNSKNSFWTRSGAPNTPYDRGRLENQSLLLMPPAGVPKPTSRKRFSVATL